MFDSWALIAWLEGAPAAPKVRSLIEQGHDSRAPMWVTSVNLGEVWYTTARQHSPDVASQKVNEIRELGFDVEPAGWALALQAAHIKAAHPIAYADCFAAALAKLRNAELVTGDHEFKRLQSEIKILWLL